MDRSGFKPNLPSRSHSLKLPEPTSEPGAGALGSPIDLESSQEDERQASEALVAQAREALQRVDDGWSKDELRPVAGKLVDRVEYLTNMVARLQESQSELQTTLLVTKSNLTLALSNTEMLEEALSRADSSKGKDIGWKRWSDREGLLKRTQTPTSSTLSQEPSTPGGAYQEIGGESLRTPPADGPTPTSATLSTRISMELERRQPNRSQSDVPSSHGSSFMLPSITSSSTTTTTSTAPPSRAPTPTPPGSEGSFFSKLRFGKSNASSSHLPDPSSSRLMPPGHQTPDFIVGPGVEDPRDALLSAEKKRADELSKMLEDERKAKAEALEDKANIELELESLSAALFEEANKMVKSERIKRAEVEEELRIAHEEKEALRSALRIVESENNASREASKSRVDLADDSLSRERTLSSSTSSSGVVVDEPEVLVADDDETITLSEKTPGEPSADMTLVAAPSVPQLEPSPALDPAPAPAPAPATIPELPTPVLTSQTAEPTPAELSPIIESEIPKEPAVAPKLVIVDPEPSDAAPQIASSPAPADTLAAAPPTINTTPASPTPSMTSFSASLMPQSTVETQPSPAPSSPSAYEPTPIDTVPSNIPSATSTIPAPEPTPRAVTSTFTPTLPTSTSNSTSPSKFASLSPSSSNSPSPSSSPSPSLKPSTLRKTSFSRSPPPPSPSTATNPSTPPPPRSPISSRIAAARQAFEAASGNADNGAKGAPAFKRGNPPPPVKIPGHVPRLPPPRASSAGNTPKEDEAT